MAAETKAGRACSTGPYRTMRADIEANRRARLFARATDHVHAQAVPTPPPGFGVVHVVLMPASNSYVAAWQAALS
jgi:hypothetical protein